jgi:hypothetical protein
VLQKKNALNKMHYIATKLQAKHKDKNNNQKKRLKALHKISVVEVEEDVIRVEKALYNATNEGDDIGS